MKKQSNAATRSLVRNLFDSNTTYRIIHYTKENQLGTDVYTSTVFNQTELQAQFDSLVKKLKDGESAEYMKEDDNQFYPSMLYVEKDNGTLYSYTHTGHRKLSKYNNY